MDKVVDYYFAPISPFAYLGHARFVAIAHRHGATIAVKPIDLGRVFAASGGLPLKQRPPQRQAYRLLELRRWSDFLGVPLNLHPRFFPVAGNLAAKWIIAALANGVDAAIGLTGALGRAAWAEERDLGDENTLAAVARELGQDAVALAANAASADTSSRLDAFTQEAIDRGVFGVPWYAYRNESFWGQDRLDFLDRELAK